jgi:predicted nucleic acid-binding protein
VEIFRRDDELVLRKKSQIAGAVDSVHYGKAREHLQASGRPIGNSDLWITAHALASKLILATNNMVEFERVPAYGKLGYRRQKRVVHLTEGVAFRARWRRFRRRSS